MFPTCSQIQEQLGGICLGSKLQQHVSACKNKQCVQNSGREACLFCSLNSLWLFFLAQVHQSLAPEENTANNYGKQWAPTLATGLPSCQLLSGFTLRDEQIQVQKLSTTWLMKIENVDQLTHSCCLFAFWQFHLLLSIRLKETGLEGRLPLHLPSFHLWGHKSRSYQESTWGHLTLFWGRQVSEIILLRRAKGSCSLLQRSEGISHWESTDFFTHFS